ncbi:MAG: hypothetical protein ABFD54_13445 [Armatimonadota bacterium]|nr:FRG domain-containing protein [bacterium]
MWDFDLPILYIVLFGEGFSVAPMRIHADHKVGIKFRDETASEIPEQMMFTWNTQQLIPYDLKPLQLPDPWIVLIVPKESSIEKSREQARKLKEMVLETDLDRVLAEQVEHASAGKTRYLKHKTPLVSTSALREDRKVLILCVWERMVFDLYPDVLGCLPVENLILDNQTIKKGFSTNRSYNLPDSSKDDFDLMDWHTMEVVPKDFIISDLAEPTVVVRIPKKSHKEFKEIVLSLKRWILLSEGLQQGRIQSFLDKMLKPNYIAPTRERNPSEKRQILIFLGTSKMLEVQIDKSAPCDIVINAGLDMFRRESIEVDDAGYILVEWSSLKPVQESILIGDIPGPGIMIMLPKNSLANYDHEVARLRIGILEAFRDEIDERLRSLGFAPTKDEEKETSPPTQSNHVQVKEQPIRGSKERPFESPAAIQEYLQSSHPERYVFRGQTQAYDGPLLPSGLRGKFIENSHNSGIHKFAGISKFGSETTIATRKALADQIVHQGGLKSENIIFSATPWSTDESDFQQGFERFWGRQGHENLTDAIKGFRGATVLLLDCLLGMEIGQALSQHYGLASAALDASESLEVALFFATHNAPFYDSSEKNDELGVIYRWPREAVSISENVLIGLESDDYVSLTESMRSFIESSKGFRVQNSKKTEEDSIMSISSERNISALKFPKGAFSQSRMGRQKGVLLWPVYERVDVPADRILGDKYKGRMETAALVGDLLKTHNGETFYFRHNGPPANLGSIDKYYLWPIQESPQLRIDSDTGMPVGVVNYDFQDKFLEFLLRFIVNDAPTHFMIIEKLAKDFPQSISEIRIGDQRLMLHMSGRCGVDPGFLVHPREAGAIAYRLLGSNAGGIPFPFRRLISGEMEQEFFTAFRDAVRSIH